MASSKKKHEREEGADDVSIELEAEEASSFRARGADALKDELTVTKKERQEYLEGWQRAQADLANFKKDAEKEKRRYREHATEDIVSELIPVLDSFDMAFRNKEAWEQAPENWRKGVEYIYTQLLGVLERNGVSQRSPLGEPFNPTLHDSVGTKPVDDTSKQGAVIEVVQKGYALHGTLIRAPKVVVGEYVS